MFIAHLPAGYLVTDALLRGRRVSEAARRRLLAAGLLASVAPDFDLLYFYLLSDRQRVHHEYLPHLPLAWVPVFAAAAVVLAAIRAGHTTWLGLAIIALNLLGHLVLDTTAGGIQWLWPFSRAEFVVAHVEARYHPWFLNFVLHWTFALELLIVALAAWRVAIGRRAAR
ncbi:MAG: metal-dependent hydrolase [Gemmatimonadetes bacterium]|nr:metal-dependent hydrolase [Gemmatimonadota bacterium]